jgi:hypothetical protein
MGRGTHLSEIASDVIQQIVRGDVYVEQWSISVVMKAKAGLNEGGRSAVSDPIDIPRALLSAHLEHGGE